MTAVAANAPEILAEVAQRRRIPLWVMALAALVVFALMEVWAEPLRLLTGLGDSDDATRLITVREFIAGAPWFDTSLPRIGAPDVLVSHWSRLVDLPLALLAGAFGLFLSRDAAEMAVRAVWPLAVFLPLLLVLARHAALSAGRAAAILALGFAVYAHSGVVQFAIGRIDHHNVMIAATVSGILLLSESFRTPRHGVAAGVLLGLSTAVGYEALVLTLLALIAAGLIGCWTGRLEAVQKTTWAFAATLLLAIVMTIAPESWLKITCDALSPNLAVLALGGAVGMSLAGRFQLDWCGRMAMAALPMVPAMALFAAIEPACLAGPFGQVDPEVARLWLSDVQEVQSILQYAVGNPLSAGQFMFAAAMALAIALMNLRNRMTEGGVFSVTMLVLATLLACWQIKLMPYATFLGVPALAIFVARLRPPQGMSLLSVRLLGFLLLNQHTVLLPLMLAAPLFQPAPEPASPPAAAMSTRVVEIIAPARCLESAEVRPLASLPPGLVVTDADFGPFIVALTGHRVLSAPYHRLDKAILETEAIKSAGPAEAKRRLDAIGADYVAICTPFKPKNASTATLAGLLHAGQSPDFLEPVRLSQPSLYKVWRIRRP